MRSRARSSSTTDATASATGRVGHRGVAPGARRPLRQRLLAVLSAVAVAGALLAGAVSDGSSASVPLGPGYWTIDEDGGVFSFGDAGFHGSLPALRASGIPIGDVELADFEPFPFLEGYWQLDENGGVFSFGSARFHGSIPGLRAEGIPVGPTTAATMAAHPNGNGYWIVGDDGGVFSFGIASFHGSIPALRADGVRVGDVEIVDIAATPDGRGYWMLDAAGGVFSFGSARFFGSVPAVRAGGTPVGFAAAVDMAATADGDGYWVLDADGGVFSFGSARFHGSVPALRAAGVRVGDAPAFALAARPPLAVKVDAFAGQDGPDLLSDWVEVGSDWRLRLRHDGGSDPAGARVLGVEGLSVGQLQRIGFTFDSGGCGGGAVRFQLHTDGDDDGDPDSTTTFACTGGGTQTFRPSSSLPSGAVVTALDLLSTNGSTVELDDVTAAGIVVEDFLTHTE